ncbi:MAG TPA: archaetidylserine decarboxylase [Oleiagrimonas sp.]|nr:archaetidylserine decarboxylase [Oleiagrimonas sp.]
MTPKILLQYLLPHRFLSRVVYHATRWTWRPWKNFLISQVVRRYQVDMAQAIQSDPLAYPHFNAFFTRELRTGARTVPTDPDAIACPADGRISQAGRIREGRILQAKGQDFSVAELLADEEAAAHYRDGHFVTVYLSPRDYHRVHMPLSGQLRHTTHIPGRIFSVAPAAVASIPRLFARNERLACHFQGEHGPFVVVMVGAMLVSSISTVWDGLVVPPYAGSITHRDASENAPHLSRASQMGRFNMGSTVIVLLPSEARLEPFQPEQHVQMGQRLGFFQGQRNTLK